MDHPAVRAILETMRAGSTSLKEISEAALPDVAPGSRAPMAFGYLERLIRWGRVIRPERGVYVLNHQTM